MNTTLEQRKLGIIEYLVDLQDESILQQIENLLKPMVSVEIPLSDEPLIQKGLMQLKEGKRIEWSDFLNKYKNRK